MTVLLTIIHVFVVGLMITVILMQSGRGGGLTQGFASAETMFGAKTNEFMVKTTSILLGIFIFTSLTLAHLSARKDQSLMSRIQKSAKQGTIPQPATTTTQQATIPQPAAETAQQMPQSDAATAQQVATPEPAATTPEAPPTP